MTSPLDHYPYNAAPLPPRGDCVTELNLAIARLALEPTEADERAIVVKEQMRSPRVVRAAAGLLDGRR